MSIHLASGGITGLILWHGLQWQLRPRTSTWISGINFALGNNTDHKSILRRSQFRKPTILHVRHPSIALSQSDCAAGHSLGTESSQVPSTPLHPADPIRVPPLTTVSAHTCLCHCCCLCSAALQHRLSSVLSSLHCLFICRRGFWKLSMSHDIIFFPQTALHANILCNYSLVWFKISPFRHAIKTGDGETHLEYPAIAQSQGNLETMQSIWG